MWLGRLSERTASSGTTSAEPAVGGQTFVTVPGRLEGPNRQRRYLIGLAQSARRVFHVDHGHAGVYKIHLELRDLCETDFIH